MNVYIQLKYFLHFIYRCLLYYIKFLASIILPYWKVGKAEIISQFQAHSEQKHEAHIGINVGLQYFNITLKCIFFILLIYFYFLQ